MVPLARVLLEKSSTTMAEAGVIVSGELRDVWVYDIRKPAFEALTWSEMHPAPPHSSVVGGLSE